MLAISIEICFPPIYRTKKKKKTIQKISSRLRKFSIGMKIEIVFNSFYLPLKIAPVACSLCRCKQKQRTFRPSDDKREINIHVVSICEAIQ